MTTTKGTILLTGANGGLGSAIAKRITSQPEFSSYYGLYTVRDATSAPSLGSALAVNSSSSHTHDILSLDLANLDSVRRVAEAINTRVSTKAIPPIETLILNAGLQDFGKQAWNEDGLDMTFVVNYLGHWLLTLLLLKSMDKNSGRIVFIGSQAHDPYDKRNDRSKAFADEKYKTIVHDQATIEAIAKGTWSSAKEEPGFQGGFRRYGASKLFLVMMMHELQHRLNQDPALQNICILGVEPGIVCTGLQRQAPWFIRVILFQIVFPLLGLLMSSGPVRSADKSASHILQAALDSNPVLGQFPKDMYLDGTEKSDTSIESKDPRKRDIVWKESVGLAHLKEGETVLQNWQ